MAKLNWRTLFYDVYARVLCDPVYFTLVEL